MTRGPQISHTSVMATGLKVGGDVEQALHSVGVPSYVLDTTGVVRWINAAAERLVGDVRGRQFTSVVAPEDSRRARELFSRTQTVVQRSTPEQEPCSLRWVSSKTVSPSSKSTART